MLETLHMLFLWIALIGADPVPLIYQGVAAVHALAALHHFELSQDRTMALCYGLVSTLYLLLAMHYGVAH